VEDADDAVLVRLIAAGGGAGHTAEAALCRRFAPRVRLYGIKHLRDEDRARDLVQTVLLAVLEAARAGRIDDPARLDRFVLGTARNTALRVHQVAARSQPVSEPLLAALAAEPIERVDLPALLLCLEALERRARDVVRRSFMEEQSAEEIAAALATTAGNVRVVRHRALAALRRCIDTPRETRA
jgi:RNA polymerase sigma-70 factor (ECF subfamily)